MKRISVLHGPNLNLLGIREPSHYGSMSLEELDRMLKVHAQTAGIQLFCQQTNSESVYIDAIHQAKTPSTDYFILNPSAFTHTSIAIRDALLAVNIPFIEVHLSNIHARESFRKKSFFSDIAAGVISGFGPNGYLLALQAIIETFKHREL